MQKEAGQAEERHSARTGGTFEASCRASTCMWGGGRVVEAKKAHG